MSEFTIAVHGLVYLGHNNSIFTSEALAENICTNPVRVRRVLAKCRKKGLVQTKKGVRGGYFLTDNLEAITLKNVYEAIKIPIIQNTWHSGYINEQCMISSGMSEAMDDLYDELNKDAIAKLATITLKDMEVKLYAIQNERGTKI